MPLEGAETLLQVAAAGGEDGRLGAVAGAELGHDPGQVQGFGGAFMFLLAQPFGHLVLGVVALGFIALGLHSLASARWIRLMGSSA